MTIRYSKICITKGIYAKFCVHYGIPFFDAATGASLAVVVVVVDVIDDDDDVVVVAVVVVVVVIAAGAVVIVVDVVILLSYSLHIGAYPSRALYCNK